MNNKWRYLDKKNLRIQEDIFGVLEWIDYEIVDIIRSSPEETTFLLADVLGCEQETTLFTENLQI